MKNAFLASSVAVLSCLIYLPANAADAILDTIYEPTPVPVIETTSNPFCDAYLGVQAGYVWGDIEYSGIVSHLLSGPMDYLLSSGKGDGVSGGLYAGCNFRQNSFLWGIEGDINLLGTGAEDHQDWYGTLRGRLGPTFSNTLIYATGGLAFGQLDAISNDQMQGFLQSYLTLEIPTAVGWAAGAGVEHWFSNKVSWKTEYLYLDLGKVTALNFQYDGSEALRADWKAHTVRTGISIHF